MSILWWLLFIPIFYFVIKKLSPPGLGQKQSTDLNHNDISNSSGKGNGNWSFVAMRYYALILNRSFHVLVTDKYVFGIHEGGIIASPTGNIDQEWQNPQNYIDFKPRQKV